MTLKQIELVSARYSASEHRPDDKAYGYFIKETLRQFESLVRAGYNFESTPIGTATAYVDSAAMFEDIGRGRLAIYSAGQNFQAKHPLGRAVGHYLSYSAARDLRPYLDWPANMTFRAVHDVNGHALTHTPFETFDGEVKAYVNHARQYSDSARPALRGETLGQLCFYFAGNGFVAEQNAIVLQSSATFGL
jgi:hypothetical protein